MVLRGGMSLVSMAMAMAMAMAIEWGMVGLMFLAVLLSCWGGVVGLLIKIFWYGMGK